MDIDAEIADDHNYERAEMDRKALSELSPANCLPDSVLSFVGWFPTRPCFFSNPSPAGDGRDVFLNGLIFLIAMCAPRERIWGQA